MGIERFYTQSIAVYSFAASATWPYDNTWSAIAGSPFKGSGLHELSGDRARMGGATEARGDGYFCLPSSVAITRAMKIKWDSRTFEIVNIKELNELAGHHQEVYVKESPEAVI
jgi:hypothetical protein